MEGDTLCETSVGVGVVSGSRSPNPPGGPTLSVVVGEVSNEDVIIGPIEVGVVLESEISLVEVKIRGDTDPAELDGDNEDVIIGPIEVGVVLESEISLVEVKIRGDTDPAELDGDDEDLIMDSIKEVNGGCEVMVAAIVRLLWRLVTKLVLSTTGVAAGVPIVTQFGKVPVLDSKLENEFIEVQHRV